MKKWFTTFIISTLSILHDLIFFLIEHKLQMKELIFDHKFMRIVIPIEQNYSLKETIESREINPITQQSSSKLLFSRVISQQWRTNASSPRQRLIHAHLGPDG